MSQSASAKLRVAIVGWGAIARATVDLLDEAIELVAVCVRSTSISPTDLPAGAVVLTDPAELTELAPDVVAEAASRESVSQWGVAALEAGADFVVSSVSAFADPELLTAMQGKANDNNARVIIQPGALAGVEALAAAKALGLDSVTHRIVKPPVAWQGTPAVELCDLEGLTEPLEFFSASAAETAAQFPKNANVAMTTALAGVGPHATQIKLVADPDATTNRHELSASGSFGTLDVSVANKPLPTNPKTSALAALSLVRTVRNYANPIVI